MGIETAILGAGALGAIGGLGGSLVQAKGASNSQKNILKAGREGADIINQAKYQSEGNLRSDYRSALDYLDNANKLLGTGYGRLDQAFGQERAIGSEGLQALRDAILGGGQNLALDPGYQFRLQQGEQAINRAANATGLRGSSGYLRDISKFNQGLASQEYGAAVQRLAGLANIGQQANANYANLGQALLGSQAGVLGNQSQLAAQLGTNLANLYQQNAIARANALIGTGTQAAQLGLAGQNAIAQGIGGLANTGSNVLGQLAFANLIGGGGGGLFGGGGGAPYAPAIGRGQSLTTGIPGY